MIAIVCLDDENGMLFNGRRQSRDRVVTERIALLAAGKKLWMNEYSAGLFAGMKPRYRCRRIFWLRREKRSCALWKTKA